MTNKTIQFSMNADASYSVAFDTGVNIHAAQMYLELNGERINPLAGATLVKEETESEKFGDCVSRVYKSVQKDVTLLFECREYADKLFLSLQIENNGKEAVVLGKCGLMETAAGAVEFGDFEDIRVLCRDGWGCKTGVVNLATDGPFPDWQWGEPAWRAPEKHRTLITGDVYNLKTRVCLSTSFLTFDRADCVIYYAANTGALQMDAFCDFSEFALPAGQTQHSEVFRLASDNSYHDCMNGWSDDVVTQYNPSFREEAGLGVLGETWCSGLVNDYAYSDMVLKNAKAVHERLKGFGVKYFWVSISNLKDRVPGNWLNCEYKQIPQNVAGLANDLKCFDMELGLWMAPFWIPDKFTNFHEEHKDQFLKKDGVPLKDDIDWCRGISAKYPRGSQRLSFFCRDGSSKAAQDYIRDVFTEYRKAGVRYYMIDFLHCSAGKYYHDSGYNEYEDKSKIAGPESYRSLLKVIRETTGEDTYLVSSSGPTFINTGLVDGSRTGPDVGEGRAATTEYSNYPGTFNLHNDGMLNLSCMNMAAVYHLNGKFYHCDSFNVVSIDKPIPVSEAQITISLAALFESPMMIGDPVFSLSEDRLRMLKKALPQNKVEETARPLDLFETKLGECPKLYYLPIERRWGKYGVLGLLNNGETTRTYTVDLENLGHDGENVLYDFWNERFLGIAKGEVSFDVPPHSIRVIRITPFENRPQLIGTDMHVLQGAVEVLHTDFDENVLTIACKRPLGESGVVTILAPASYVPQKYEGFHVSKVSNTNLCIITKEIKFDIPTVTIVLPFENTDKTAGDGSHDIV